MNKDAGRGGFLFVMLRLESGEELPFIVDTASPVTYLSKSLEPKLGKRLGTTIFSKYGKQISGRYPAPKLYLGSSRLITGTNVFTFDFNQLSSRSGYSIMGALGLDCLRHYCIQLDFQAGVLRFLQPHRLDAAPLGKAFPITFSRVDQKDSAGYYPVINHCGLMGGKDVRLMIDTGCNIDGLVDKDLVRQKASHLPEIVWDGETYTNIHVGMVERANALGLRFLARHLVTIAFPTRTMYLKKTNIGPLNMDGKNKRPNTAPGLQKVIIPTEN